MPEKLCISCEWFRVHIKGERWSDWTPGSAAYIGCAASCKPRTVENPEPKDHWGFDPADPEEGYFPTEGKEDEYEYKGADLTELYRQNLKIAETCSDYTDLRESLM